MTPRGIRAFIGDEGILVFASEGRRPEAWPIDQRLHLLPNVAVGGDRGGQNGVDEAAFPASMVVDRVRVYALQNP